jgi:trk system potassium uptake protein TrkH
MNARAIIAVLGTLLLVTGCSMVLPVICALLFGEDDWRALTLSAIIIIFGGLLVRRFFRFHGTIQIKEGVLVAVAGWIVISAVSTLPFLVSGYIPSFTDAFFEMMSGYTTTGATILEDIEALPHGLLFWRSQTHLLGGMGFLTLTLIFLPHGVGGVRVFRAESSPGQVITREKFMARNRDAMIWLWTIYLGLNALQTLLLCGGGMAVFDALCTAFGTISTSGYSPRNLSIGAYDSGYVDWVTTCFMWCGGVSFVLYYVLLKGDIATVLRNTELRWYVLLTLLFCLLVSCGLWFGGIYSGFWTALRYGSFQVVSLLTTTGFTTADYELWPAAAQMGLFVVCFVGACAGSTTSGIKIVHYVVLAHYFYGAVVRMFVQPLAVFSVRLNGKPVEQAVIDLSVCYFVINIFMVAVGAMILCVSDHLDMLTSMSAVISALMNIGPGFGGVGPAENFAFLSIFGKWFLAFNMLVGRLEMFTALIVLLPIFWRGVSVRKS